MFWDNVLFASTMGNYLFENGIFQWNFPDIFDPGHPPFLALIQAIGWKLFGQKLWVSHLILLPFVFGLLYQLFRLVTHYISNTKHQIAALVLIIADPTLLTQLLLVNPEVIQLFFFFLAINGILSQKVGIKTLGLFFLGIVTYRGMMLCAGVFLFEAVRILLLQKKPFKVFLDKKMILSYVIGALPALCFVVWRLLAKGWLQTHPDSPWANCWHFVNLTEFVRNLLVLAHRFFDFGRIAIFLFLFGIFLFKRNLLKNEKVKEVMLLAVSSVFFVVVISMVSTNPFGHRYFIASYVSFILLAFLMVEQLNTKKAGVYLLLIASLMGGNFWIYPEQMAQGWDASLAHTPYYKLRDSGIDYLDKQQIEINQVGTFFPNVAPLNGINLNGDKRKFARFNNESEYVFYSNVYNLTDEQYSILKTEYTTIYEIEKKRILVRIMKRK